MMERVVGISEIVVSDEPGDVLVTYSLGSCIGLALYDREAGVAGLLHSMMPASKADPEKALRRPAMYTDTGTSLLLQQMFDRGATRSGLLAWAAGAATQVDHNGFFRIGERNYAVMRKVLWKNGVLLTDEDVGGSFSRTLIFDVANGRAFVKSKGTLRELRGSRGGRE